MIDEIGRVRSIDDRHVLYENVLYADANPAIGDDTNNGSRGFPYLTIAGAVADASEYTIIYCVDSRAGAAAVGFDEDAAITGVTVAKNYISIVGYSCWDQGHKISVGNTIANADNVFNITGDHVMLSGINTYLQDINGDEIAVLASGNSFRMVHCDVPAGIPAAAQNECIKVTGNNCVIDYVHTMLSDVGLHLNGVSVARIRNSTFQRDTEDSILIDNGSAGAYIDSCQFQFCNDAIHIAAGCIYHTIYECNFANVTTIWNNLGGATNHLINAKETSQIVANNTAEQDRKDIYDAISTTKKKLPFKSDLQASLTLDNTGVTDPALPSVTIPAAGAASLPAGATIDAVFCHLVYGSRRDTSGVDNAVNTGPQYIQVEESGVGPLINAIKIVDNSLLIDVSESTVMGGNVIFGNIDVSSELDAAGKTYDFQWTNCKVAGNNLILDDVQMITEWWYY